MIEAPAQQRENQWVSSEWAGPPCAAAAVAHKRTSSRLSARDPNGLGIVPVGQVSATVSYKTRSTQTKRGATRPEADQHRRGGGECNIRLSNNQRLLFIRKPNTLIGTSQYKKNHGNSSTAKCKQSLLSYCASWVIASLVFAQAFACTELRCRGEMCFVAMD